MNTRAITLVTGLALLAAACGAETDPVSNAGTDLTPSTQATEGATTTVQPESPETAEDENRVDLDDDYGVDPDAAPAEDGSGDQKARTPAAPEPTTPPEGPTEVGGGKIVEPVPVEDAPTPTVGEVPADLMDAILADLSALTGADASAATVVRGEFVVWNDGSLGCPEPGVYYTQATISGYWVVLDHEGTHYDYRARNDGLFRRCETPTDGHQSLNG